MTYIAPTPIPTPAPAPATSSPFPSSSPYTQSLQQPPPPPPKPSSSDASRTGTPTTGPPPPPPPPPPRVNTPLLPSHHHNHLPNPNSIPSPNPSTAAAATDPDPGPSWLPEIVKNKSKSDLEDLLSTPTLLNALTNSLTSTTQTLLQTQLSSNIALAQHLLGLADELQRAHAQTTSHLLRVRAQERAWRAKQAELDRALQKFSPMALYQRLVGAVAEQEALCAALEESFLDGAARAGEREVAEFVKRFRERREVWCLRREEKERWDEGRVGGWR